MGDEVRASRLMFLASFDGFLGEQESLAREETAAFSALAETDVNPYELLYLIGAHADLGNTERAFEILRRQLRDGRLAALGYVGTVAPELLDTAEYATFHGEHGAEKRRLQNRYAPAQ